MIHYHGNSLSRALTELFPTIAFDKSKFRRGSGIPSSLLLFSFFFYKSALFSFHLLCPLSSILFTHMYYQRDCGERQRREEDYLKDMQKRRDSIHSLPAVGTSNLAPLSEHSRYPLLSLPLFSSLLLFLFLPPLTSLLFSSLSGRESDSAVPQQQCGHGVVGIVPRCCIEHREAICKAKYVSFLLFLLFFFSFSSYFIFLFLIL